MSDCANVEIRELLPEYLHDRLGASQRALVEAHLTDCEDCSAELGTLRAVRLAYARGRAIDTAGIVRALPKPPARVQRPVARRMATWQRIAAAISFISLGGISLAVSRSFFSGEGAVVSPDTPIVVATSPAETARAAAPAISFGGGVSDIATEDLEKLLGALETLEAAPPAEPEGVPQTDRGRVKSDTSGE
jgi:anti-sigma factor RsiW